MDEDQELQEEYEYEESDSCLLPGWILGGVVVGALAAAGVCSALPEGGGVGFAVFLQTVMLFFLIGLLHSIRNNVRAIAQRVVEAARSRNVKSIAAVIVGSMLLSGVVMACSKSDVALRIEATRDAEQTAEAEEVATSEATDADGTATAEAEDAKARSLIAQYCDGIEARFKTENALPSITITRMVTARDWLDLNADANSEIADIVLAFEYDIDRTQNGGYVSWADAFQQSGSKYIGDCKEASWKR